VPGVVSRHPAILITHYFHRCYGPSVVTALRTLTLAKDFVKPHLGLCCFTANEPLWMAASFAEMHLILQRLPKQSILDLLRRIPTHLRPPYSSHTARSSSSTLVEHIRQCLHLLVSLQARELCGVYVSLIPFDLEFGDTQSALIEKLFAVNMVMKFYHHY